MKNTHRLVILAGAVLALASVTQTNAQSYATGPAASPKARQALAERAAMEHQQSPAAACCKTPAACCDSAVAVGYQPTGSDGITASPKVRQALDEKAAIAAASHASTNGSHFAGYKPTGDDGITASPKTRQMLDEHRQVVEIAPLK